MAKRFRGRTSKVWTYVPPRFRDRIPVTASSPSAPAVPVAPAAEMSATMRFGFFVKAGSVYSGGRIMLSMYALALARAGGEVWFVTDGSLRWRKDFAWGKKIRFVGLRGCLPDDLDVLITDCRGAVARLAVDYKRKHPAAVLHVVAFETPNWVEKYAPELGARMKKEDFSSIEASADRLIAISAEGAKYLRQWYGNDKPIDVVYPGLNTEAADAATPVRRRRPFAVFAARPVSHKHLDVAMKAVMAMAAPFDIVVIGSPGSYRAKGNAGHKVLFRDHVSDVDKFGYLKGARIALAPSTFEGFGMVPGEALISGTPAVVYDLPVLREAYGDDLVYAGHDNAPAFVEAARKAALGPKPDMAAAEARTRKHFGLDSFPERIQKHAFHIISKHRLSVSMIAYATPGVEAALAALYPQVDEINIAYGPVPFWRSFPEGGALERIRAFPDPEKKITVIARPVWPHKRAMWMSCGERATGNYMLITGADMIWVGLEEWMRAGHHFATPRWVNFWHDFGHWIHGPAANAPPAAGHGHRWGQAIEPFGSVCNHHLFSWWRPSYRWKTHTQPYDAAGRSLFSPAANYEGANQTPETVCYHFGHALPDELMRRKHQFYIDRDGGGGAAVTDLTAREKAWHEWTGGIGPCGDGIVARVGWDLPEEVRAAERILHGIATEARDVEAAG